MKKSALILASLLISFCVMAQKTVSGVVTLEDTGEPEPGVNVIVTGTSTGTITDIDGNYSLTVPEGKTISFSYIGYVGQTLKVNSGKIDVVMSPDNKILDEVVAVGYGTMKKSDLTGAISSVKSDALQKSASSGVDQALQGRAAGVTVNANSGQPGAAAAGWILDMSNFVSNGDTQPDSAIFGIKLLVSVIPGVLYASCAIVMAFYNIDADTTTQMKIDLEAKRASEL